MLNLIGIVVARSRSFEGDYQACLDAFKQVYEEGDQIVAIGSPEETNGFAERIARDNGLTLTIHYQNRQRHGNHAVFVLNSVLAQDCDVLIAVYDEESTSMVDVVQKARKLKKKVVTC